MHVYFEISLTEFSGAFCKISMNGSAPSDFSVRLNHFTFFDILFEKKNTSFGTVDLINVSFLVIYYKGAALQNSFPWTIYNTISFKDGHEPFQIQNSPLCFKFEASA